MKSPQYHPRQYKLILLQTFTRNNRLINRKFSFLFHHIQLFDIHSCDLDEASSGEECDQLIDGCFRSLHFHLDISVIEVLYPAGKPQLVCFVLGIIPEANTLYASVKYDMFSDAMLFSIYMCFSCLLFCFRINNNLIISHFSCWCNEIKKR